MKRPLLHSLPIVILSATLWAVANPVYGNWEAVFPEASELGAGWIEGDWPGLVHTGNEPWYYSTTHGWLHPAGSNWFFDAGQGQWVWTRSDFFPFLYLADGGEWITYTAGESPDRVFYHEWGQAWLDEKAGLEELTMARARGVLDFAHFQHQDLIRLLPEYDQSVELYPEDDGWKKVPTRSWVSGFFPASMWLNYNASGLLPWKAQGERRLEALEVEKTRTTTHDLGFMIGLPFSLAYDITGEPGYAEVIVTAAGSLASRFSSVVRATRSWSHGSWDDGTNFSVIIDNMMNMELLLRAATLPGGNPAWREMALVHARTTIREHIREDGGTYHVVVFNGETGEVDSKATAQGYDADSTWSRGQAWAVHGFAIMLEYTGEADMREAAVRVAGYFIDNLPENGIAPWDFDAPGDVVPTDTSASAVAASGLLRLAAVLGAEDPFGQTCRETALRIITSLSKRPHLAVGADYGALLTGGSRASGQYNQSLIYGDYYLLEACQRLLGIFPERQ